MSGSTLTKSTIYIHDYGPSSSGSSGYEAESPYFFSQRQDNRQESSPKSRNSKPLKVWTDGAAKNNGRAGTRAGWGVYFGPNHPDNDYGPVSVGPHTNQRAELQAILRAAVIHADNLAPEKLIIHTDSRYAIDAVTTWTEKWEQNGYLNAKGEPVANQDLIRTIKHYVDFGNIEFVHVRGHTGVEGNEAADRLANLGARSVS